MVPTITTVQVGSNNLIEDHIDAVVQIRIDSLRADGGVDRGPSCFFHVTPIGAKTIKGDRCWNLAVIL